MINEENEELKKICRQMAYGDDSKETFHKYVILMGLNLSQEEEEILREETFD
jgi:hypothetical protein